MQELEEWGNKRFGFTGIFTGWDHFSLGFHICFSMPNVEIHLPFGFFRLGFINIPKNQWSNIVKNILEMEDNGEEIKCDGNDNVLCLGNMKLDIIQKTLTCDTCNKKIRFKKPDMWKLI